MNRALATLVLVLGLTLAASAERFRVVEWNVENLFDTCRDAGFDDREFQAEAQRRWNAPRYWTKLRWLARTLATLGGDRPAELVALCEVENDSVLAHLTRRSLLRRLGYAYVMTHSRDPRGIDVALLYQPARFRVLSTASIRIAPPGRHLRPTRDVLHVAGLLPSLDTLDVFVCHLPSRSGGSGAARYRMAVARRLRAAADSLERVRSAARILMLGDFNTEPDESPLRVGLRAMRPDVSSGGPADLYIVSADLTARDGIRGTYRYQGRWNRLDHILVNGRLLDSAQPLHLRPDGCRIAAPAFLTQPDATNGGVKPFRTFLGPRYVGGPSDHLPLVADFEWQQ